METHMDANESNGHQDDPGSDTQQLPASIERRDTAINDSNSNSGTKKEKYWPQRIETICAVLLVVITGTYTYYANKQWSAMKGQLKEMQSQTTLSRQQLIGAQAAIVVVAEYPGIEIPNYG